MFTPLALLGLLASSGAAVVEQQGTGRQEGSCQSIDDDCLDGFTSLLQESAHLLPSQAKEAAGKPVSFAESRASRNAKSTAKNALWTLLGVVVFGLFFFVFLVKPAMRRHEQLLARGPQKVWGTDRKRIPSFLETFVLVHDNQDVSPEDVEIRMHDSLQDDTYSMAIAIIVRDLRSLATGVTHVPVLRVTRLVWAFGLILLTAGLQSAVLVGTKMYVTPQQVASIRDAYDQYEVAMYGEEHTYELESTGFHRGKDMAYFNASAFDDLDDDLKSDICNIPLSQLSFLSLILLVWAVTCCADLKQSMENFMALIVFTDTSDTMEEALTQYDQDDDDEEDEGGSDINDGIPTQVITALTLPVKIFLSLTIFLPNILTTVVLLWLGSRWLTATNDFGNLISNAVALEFVLALKQLLLSALASERNKRELSHTGLAPCWTEEPAGYGVYFNTATWAALAFFWVWFYVHYQGVLPEYKWDVHAMCSPWLSSQLEG